MTLLRSVSGAAVLALLLAAGAPAAVLSPGTLYGLVFDNASLMETVVTVDPVTAAFTPVGAGVADCCTIGGFPVLALDPDTGAFYAAGNRFSDPPGSPMRLLGFDAVSGALVSSPFLPTGFNYNILKLDVGNGTLYALVFDFATSRETVVTVDPTTAVLTPVGGGIVDCCTIGGFNVSALDPDGGRFYAAGNLLSDPVVSPKRLLGFDVVAGTLASSPFLPGGFNYNDFELDPLTGTLYGLVFDFATSQELVVTIDPATAALTPVGAGIADCCTVSSFSTLDPHNGAFYIMGNRLSDPPGSAPRLLGFDVASGSLATTPFLPAGWNYNVLQAAVVPPANQPPVAVCRDVAVSADPGLCTAAASIDDGSHDPDGDPLTLSQDPAGPYAAGDTLVTLTVEDGQGGTDSCSGTVTVTDAEAPVVLCNSPATITPPQAPISFTASAGDACGAVAVEIVGYDCWMFTKKGKRVDKTASCEVDVDGATVTILDSGGVGDHISWEVHAADGGGNEVTVTCEVVVTNPGHP